MAIEMINVRFFCRNRVVTSEYMMYPTGAIDRGGVIYEWTMKLPRDVNRLALHRKYSYCAIEWCGDVSFAPTTHEYACYTIDSRDIVPIIIALMNHHYTANVKRIWISPSANSRITPQSIKAATDLYYEGSTQHIDGYRRPPFIMNGSVAMTFEQIRGDTFGPRWIVAHIMKMLIIDVHKNTCINPKSMRDFVDKDPNWVVIPEINRDDAGWWMACVIAVHSPLFNAYMAQPPIGISFVDIEESSDAPSSSDVPDDSKKHESSKASRQEQRVDTLNSRVRDLELTIEKYRDYVGHLRDNLNPRLPGRMRLKSIADIESNE